MWGCVPFPTLLQAAVDRPQKLLANHCFTVGPWGKKKALPNAVEVHRQTTFSCLSWHDILRMILHVLRKTFSILSQLLRSLEGLCPQCFSSNLTDERTKGRAAFVGLRPLPDPLAGRPPWLGRKRAFGLNLRCTEGMGRTHRRSSRRST